jgi:hypothetical protein
MLCFRLPCICLSCCLSHSPASTFHNAREHPSCPGARAVGLQAPPQTHVKNGRRFERRTKWNGNGRASTRRPRGKIEANKERTRIK